MGQLIQTEVGGSAMDVYLALPEGAEPSPGVVVLHGRQGVVDFTRDLAEKLAKAGFVAAAPDILHRTPSDMDISAKVAAVLDAEALQDIAATYEAIKSRAEIVGDKIAILGHCLGGRMSFLGASSFSFFRAAIVYYGGNMFKARGNGPKPFDLLKNIRCPVLGFFGGNDTNPSPADVSKIDAELTQYGVEHIFHSYLDAGHAFQDVERPEKFNQRASTDSWQKTIGFLRHQLEATT